MNLSAWLERIQSLGTPAIDLSLERVQEVARRLNLKKGPVCITVGGTNGKGSTVAGLESIYREAGFKTGVFTSPILFKHNEYVRIQGQDASDEAFCRAFEKIDQARGEVVLTPFEFNTLAAFEIFREQDLDVWILEVGLGGRFDAVNVIDADIAIVTSIGIDHTEWLGDTREKIAFEKAGIFRSGKPAICGDVDPPVTLTDYAKKIDAPFYCQNQEFRFLKKADHWQWQSEKNHFKTLPIPSLALQNMSSVLMALELAQNFLPVTETQIQSGLKKVKLAGRIQVVPGKIEQIFDVSHNPASAAFLDAWLREHPCRGKARAVFSMLADKDILATIQVMRDKIDEWHVASLLPLKRAASLEKLLSAFQSAGLNNIFSYDTVKMAYQNVMQRGKEGDRVIVFGSFHTVAECI